MMQPPPQPPLHGGDREVAAGLGSKLRQACGWCAIKGRGPHIRRAAALPAGAASKSWCSSMRICDGRDLFLSIVKVGNTKLGCVCNQFG